MSTTSNSSENFVQDSCQFDKVSGEFVTQEQLVCLIKEVVSSLDGDLTLYDLQLQEELEELALAIKLTKKEIAALSPKDIREHDIPSATDELDAVIGATEEATGVILDVCEHLDNISADLGHETGDKVRSLVQSVYEACNFQDITGQRISKVVRTLKHIESRLLVLLSAFGEESEGVREQAGSGEQKPISDVDLLNGPQLPDNAMQQSDIDAIMGFS